jgi:acetyl esterase/lipase
VALLVAGSAVLRAQVPVAAQVVTADVYPEHRVNFPGGVTGLPDQIYANVPSSRPLTLDLYLPPAGVGGDARPFIVYVHGGGWSGGSQRNTAAFENWPEVLASIAAKGYVVASISYRLTGEAKMPAQIQDVKSAIRWMRSKASRYGIDKTRGLVWGPSAGGHLAGLAATSCGVAALEPAAPGGPGSGAMPAMPVVGGSAQESDCVQAAVLWYGLFDFEKASPPAALFGCDPGSCSPDVLRAASPVTYIAANDPPMLIIAGDKDATIPPDQSRQFDAALKAKGVKSELMIIPGVGHSFIGPDQKTTSNATNQALKKTLEFIDATIGAKK